jgi:hypothetical protein
MDPTDKARRREAALQRIRDNIESSGFHIYSITPGPCPRWAYTIGLRDRLGSELVVAGASCFDAAQVGTLLHHVVAEGSAPGRVQHPDLGAFTVRPVHASWGQELLLGALDYLDVDEVPALQLVPEPPHHTVDVPDLSRPRAPTSEPAWRWLDQDWDLPVPEASMVFTDLDALRGQPITEASRWEEDTWEAFSRPVDDVPREEVRSVPVGVLLGADPSFRAAVELPVGKSLIREPGEPWEPWGS